MANTDNQLELQAAAIQKAVETLPTSAREIFNSSALDAKLVSEGPASLARYLTDSGMSANEAEDAVKAIILRMAERTPGGAFDVLTSPRAVREGVSSSSLYNITKEYLKAAGTNIADTQDDVTDINLPGYQPSDHLQRVISPMTLASEEDVQPTIVSGVSGRFYIGNAIWVAAATLPNPTYREFPKAGIIQSASSYEDYKVPARTYGAMITFTRTTQQKSQISAAVDAGYGRVSFTHAGNKCTMLVLFCEGVMKASFVNNKVAFKDKDGNAVTGKQTNETTLLLTADGSYEVVAISEASRTLTVEMLSDGGEATVDYLTLDNPKHRQQIMEYVSVHGDAASDYDLAIYNGHSESAAVKSVTKVIKN